MPSDMHVMAGVDGTSPSRSDLRKDLLRKVRRECHKLGETHQDFRCIYYCATFIRRRHL
jgi:hypothetical protein